MAHRNDLLRSTTDINLYIKSHKQAFASYYSDLLEAFAFLSPMRFYLVTALVLSNISNFTRTLNPLSLVVNVPSIIMLLVYPILRDRKILGQGHASSFSFLLMLALSLQWSFSFYVLTVSSPEHRSPTLVSLIMAALWVFALGSRRLFNYAKSLLASGIFLGIMTAIDPNYTKLNLGGLSVSLCIGYCFNYAIDLTLRFRFFVMMQQEQIIEKTAKIETIFQASPIAFFTVNSALALNEDASPALQTILAIKVEKGHTLASLLAQTSMAQDEQRMVLDILQACMQESPLSFELNAGHLPHHFTLTNSRQEARSIKASYTPLLDNDQLIYEILVTFVDITHEETEAESRLLIRTEGETLLQFVRIPPHLARLFVQSGKELASSLMAFTETAQVPTDLPRRLHTLKGNARSLGLTALAQMIHELEDQLQKSGHQAQAFRISRSLHELLQRLQEFQSEVMVRSEENTTLRGFMSQIVKEAAQNACLQLNKPEPKLALEVDEDQDSPRLRRFLFEVLPLLVTNAMDHGIEDSKDRHARGKPLEGLLTMKVSGDAGNVHILFQDDGQGLDIERIRRKTASVQGANAAVIATSIFAPGFSTRDVVSTLSGRGVGLDAVAERVREAHGTLEITSYRPFCLSMVMPRA